MRKLLLLTVLLYFGVPLASFAQSASKNLKKDYLDFSSNGDLIAFKKTAPDGSWIEVRNEAPRLSPTCFPITVHCSDGEELTSHIHTDRTDLRKSKESLYRNYVEKATSFNGAINCIPNLFHVDETPSICKQSDGTVLYYDNNSSNRCHITLVSFPIGSKGDYCKVFINGYSRYLKKEQLTDEWVSGISNVRRSYEDCVIDINKFQNNLMNGRIDYSDGSFYTGWFSFDKGNPADWKYWRNNSSHPVIKYVSGVLKTKDKQYKGYSNGEYSEFETARVIQSMAKKEAEEKAKAEAVKKAVTELNKKYGEKYVKAMLEGRLILGTPEQLFLLGVEVGAYSTITKVEHFYSSSKRNRYSVYGWNLDTSKKTMLSNSTWLGYITFENGVLISLYED